MRISATVDSSAARHAVSVETDGSGQARRHASHAGMIRLTGFMNAVNYQKEHHG